MAISKIILNIDGTDVTQIDLTQDTVEASVLMSPYTAHDAAGLPVVGTASGGGGVTEEPEKDVNFIDYDGTIVASYTAAEFAQLSALPSSPTHDGLTAQGWNWSLSDAQTYVATYGKLWIGQNYITDDGATRVYICLDGVRLSPYLGFGVNGSATVDWGDNSTEETITGSSAYSVISTMHTYATAGSYCISILPDANSEIAFYGDSSYGSRILWNNQPSNSYTANSIFQNSVKKIEIGRNATLYDYACLKLYNLESVSLPNTMTSLGYYSTFQSCRALRAVVIPNGITLVPNYAFQSSLLGRVSLPNSITSIGYSSTGGVFQYSYVLSLTLPDTITTVSNTDLNYCYTLRDVIIPEGVTTIETSGITNCYCLSKIVIPSSMATIKSFSQQQGLKELRFSGLTPPALSSANTFLGLPTDCIIYVPTGSLSAYTSATNYPSSSTYTYVEY